MIKLQERSIIASLGWNNLITTTTYEFVKTYFYDFQNNNEAYINRLSMTDVLEEFENASVYLSKLIMHFDGFYLYR